jgi:hypothetical protein
VLKRRKRRAPVGLEAVLQFAHALMERGFPNCRKSAELFLFFNASVKKWSEKDN